MFWAGASRILLWADRPGCWPAGRICIIDSFGLGWTARELAHRDTGQNLLPRVLLILEHLFPARGSARDQRIVRVNPRGTLRVHAASSKPDSIIFFPIFFPPFKYFHMFILILMDPNYFNYFNHDNLVVCVHFKAS